MLESKLKRKETKDSEVELPKMQITDYGSPQANTEASGKKEIDLCENSPSLSESEGEIHKQILISIGSMAQLKHPRKYWPKFAGYMSQNTLYLQDSWGENSYSAFKQPSTRSQLIIDSKQDDVFAFQ